MKSLIILVYLCIALILSGLCNDIIMDIILIWVMGILASSLVRFRLDHPYTWFSAFFLLYSTGYPIVCLLGLNVYGYSSENIRMSMIALGSCLIVIGPELSDMSKYPLKRIRINVKKTESLIKILCFILILSGLILRLRGYAGKAEMQEQNDIFYRIGVYIARFGLLFILFLACYYQSIRFNIKLIVLMICSFMLFAMITGERDVIFRFIFSILVFLIVFRKIKLKHLSIIVPLGVVFMILSVIFKYYLSRGEMNSTSLSEENNIVIMFLSTDFTAAAGNLQYLLNNSWTRSSLGPELIVTELLYPFIQNFDFVINPDDWFNYTVHTGEYHGYAFTLVGTGYVSCGILGVILIFSIVGYVIRIFYRNSIINIYWLASYIYITSTIIFSLRQSLNTIPTALIKVLLVGVVFSKFFLQNHRTNKNAFIEKKSYLSNRI